MAIFGFLLLALAALGHVVFWVALVNRTHSINLNHLTLSLISCIWWAALLIIPAGLYGVYIGLPHYGIEPSRTPLMLYVLLAAWFGAYCALLYAWETLYPRDRPLALLSTKTSTVAMFETLGFRPIQGRAARLLSRLPGNEVLDLQLQELELRLDRLPPDLDELTVAHLSDLHMSGCIQREYFEEVCALANDFEPDLTVITGDLFDAEECVEWIPQTLGKLRARYGVYFVLGNHDLRVDCERARSVLTEAGLIDLGGAWQLLDIQGKRLLIAGNELPWFTPAADLRDAPFQDGHEKIFRLLLSHAPDQIRWACEREFDLVLAGHTHGGQIRLPVIGPVLSPSRLGTRYANGTFHVGQTMLHVSRGTGTLTPLRWNCPPELALLVLRSGAVLDAQKAAAAANAS